MSAFKLQLAPADGVLRFSSTDRLCVWRWLSVHLGMRFGPEGWSKPGWRGAAMQSGDTWHAAVWPDDTKAVVIPIEVRHG